MGLHTYTIAIQISRLVGMRNEWARRGVEALEGTSGVRDDIKMLSISSGLQDSSTCSSQAFQNRTAYRIKSEGHDGGLDIKGRQIKRQKIVCSGIRIEGVESQAMFSIPSMNGKDSAREDTFSA